MNRTIHYFILAGVFLTGASALVVQVGWQRYFGYLIGSDQKSSALVLSMFLAGLSLGYRYFSSVASRISSRKKLLQVYAVVEVCIGLIFILSPFAFQIIEEIFSNLPVSILTDFLQLLPIIGTSSFLMGATLPLLTLALPDKVDEIEPTHARIYAWNTLGAFLGVLAGGLYFLPKAGLQTGFLVVGTLDLVVGILFFLVSSALKADVAVEAGKPLSKKAKKAYVIPQRTIVAFAFFVSAVILALELICMRILSISISGIYLVYPIVVAAFILGIGIGSLYLERRSQDKEISFLRPLRFGILGIIILYLVAPYLPFLVNSLKTELKDLNYGWSVFAFSLTLGYILLVFPIAFFLGQILPSAVFALNRQRSEVAKVIGQVYSLSTLGTLFGSIFLGYLFLKFVNLDFLLKIMIIGLAVFHYLLSSLRTNKLMLSTFLFCVIVLVIPKWNRIYLEYPTLPKSIVDQNKPWKWGFAQLANEAKLLSYKDGPDVSASVTESSAPHPNDMYLRALTLNINGKPDGSTYGDFATNSQASLIPYLLAPNRFNLNTAVVGLGTGVTAGAMGSFEHVKKVDVIEISSAVIEQISFFENFNFQLTNLPKVKVHHQDAVRFFRSNIEKYDLIVSMPTNLWISGTENLYMPKYLKVISNSMAEDGIYVQWVHGYGMDLGIFLSAMRNLLSEFPYVRIYGVQPSDFLALASKKEFNHLSKNWTRFDEPIVQQIRHRVGWRNPETIALAHRIDQEGLQNLLKAFPPPAHTLDQPSIGYNAAKSWFKNEQLHGAVPWSPELSRLWAQYPVKQNEFTKLAAQFESFYNECVTHLNLLSSMCVTFMTNTENFRIYKSPKSSIRDRLQAYKTLRDQSLIASDPLFLDELQSTPDLTSDAKAAIEQERL